MVTHDNAVSTTTPNVSKISKSGKVKVKGKALQIVDRNEKTEQFELDLKALSSILMKKKIRDKPVALISIAGDFRKGKSFILNLLLRYLQHGRSPDWLDDKEESLKGFSWKGGSKRNTIGILMWSQPFLVKLKDGLEVAVLLMDTQGTFDTQSVIKDSVTIFALSTLVSSVQVFNLFRNIQGDNLHALEIFTEYGRLALESSDIAPFQKLLFLIRDWPSAFEYEYGLKGGCKLLDDELAIDDKAYPHLTRVRQHIKDCFSEIECFLMPFPGKEVSTNPEFDGRISDISEDFIKHLKDLVPLLLAPENLVVKNIRGKQVTGRELLEYFKVYIDIFKGETIPEPKSMLEATAEANHLAALASAKEIYMKHMEETCGGSKPFIKASKLKLQHENFHKESLKHFLDAPKFGQQLFTEQYRLKLEEELRSAFERFAEQNKSKNMFSALGTSLVLIVLSLTCFIVSKMVSIVGIAPFSNFIYLIGIVSICIDIAYIAFV